MKLTRRHAVLLAASAAVAPAVARAADEDGVGSVGDIVNYGWATIAPDPRGEIEFEDSVYMNEVIETDDESAVVVHFADGSKLTIGENAKVVIDRYVYDPAGSNSELSEREWVCDLDVACHVSEARNGEKLRKKCDQVY